MKPIILATILTLFVAACADGFPTVTVTSLCATADATVRSLTVAKAQGQLSEAQIAKIDQAVLAIDPICGAEFPPETTLTLDTIERQLLILQGVKGVR